MLIQTITFYAFAAVLVLSALSVITVRNPVHSVLCLILAFFNAAGLFVMLGAEFVAMILVIVYVGAVAVLFLFVVMMLDIDFAKLRSQIARYAPLGFILGLVLLTELALLFKSVFGTSAFPQHAAGEVENTKALGAVLYTDYVVIFQTSGLILLVAMIGAIVLTLRHRPGVRRQKVAEQLARTKDETIEIQKITPGSGL
ncbi:MAG: NADH-quinone oxidoreductase subunit J [Pseudobdellovibrionaceae bacterium]